MSGAGALCVGARRSVCRGPALFVSGPALSVGARRSFFVSGPGALCAGARLSFHRAPALSVRVCVEPGLFLYRSSALLSALCVGARHSPPFSLCRDPALCVGVCVRAWRSPVASETGSVTLRRSLCRGPALFLSGPGGLCRLFASGAALCVGARRSLRRAVFSQDSLLHAPAVCVSGPGAFCRGLCRGRAVLSGALCVGARRSVSGPGAFCVGARRSFFVSGPGAL